MSLTNTLYRAARLSATARATRRGPSALAKRVVRRQVYRVTTRATRTALRRFGM